MGTRDTFRFGLAPIALLTAAQPAMAQDQVPPSEPADAAPAATAPQAPSQGDAQAAGTDEAIVVTAQRRSQRLKDVPMSITALSGDELTAKGIGGAKELAFAVPSLNVQEWGGGKEQVIIRGISGIRGTSSLTGVYLDEIPLSGPQDGFVPGALNARTYDLERVEVLKGPQGTLFGEGATGGVIRYITKRPNLTQVGGSVSATGFLTEDGDPSVQFVGVINAPIVQDKFAVRVAGTYEKNGGWIDNVGTGERDINDNRLVDVRAKALFVPVPELEISGLVEVHRNKGGGPNYANILPYGKSLFLQAVDPDAPTSFKDNFEIYNLTASYDFGFATLLSSTSHARAFTSDNYTQLSLTTPNNFSDVEIVQPVPPLQIFIPDITDRMKMTTQEVRLTSNGSGPFKWVVGGIYKKSRLQWLTPGGVFLFIPPSFNLEIPQVQGRRPVSRSVAGFVDGSYRFGALEVGGGIRLFSDRLKLASSLDDVTETAKGKFRKTTWRAFAKYDVTPDINVYANVGTGFRSGGFNTLANVQRGAPAAFDPETAIFYEIGSKGRAFDSRLNYSVAGFIGKFRDQFQDFIDLNPPDAATNGPLQYTINGGSSRIRGIEWDFTLRASPSLRLSFAGDIMSAKFTKVSNAAGIAVGSRVDNVPKYDLNFSADYDFQWRRSVPGFFNITYSRKGPQSIQDGALAPNPIAPPTYIPALDFLQASIGADVGGMTITLFGRNLLDERKPLSASTDGTAAQARP